MCPPFYTTHDEFRAYFNCPELSDREVDTLIEQIEALVQILADDYLASLPEGARLVKN